MSAIGLSWILSGHMMCMKKNKYAGFLISNRDSRLSIDFARLTRFLGGIRKSLRLGKQTVEVVFAPDAEIKRLNRKYLKHPWPTDVLAFPLSSDFGADFLGEVVVSANRARVQCRRFRESFEHELARYIVHGILHLCGEKDKQAAERRRMKIREDRILAICSKEIEGLFAYGNSKR